MHPVHTTIPVFFIESHASVLTTLGTTLRYLERGRFPQMPHNWRPISRLWWSFVSLTHWERVTHISVDDLTIIGSDNCSSPGRRQAIIWTNAGILLIGPIGTNISEISIEILTFSFKKLRLKVSCAEWRSFSLGLSVLSFDWCSLSVNVVLYEIAWTAFYWKAPDCTSQHHFNTRSYFPAKSQNIFHSWQLDDHNCIYCINLLRIE